MNALVPYLAALHQQDLLEQAALRRRQKLSTASQPSVVPAWRRTLGGALASAARTLDPETHQVTATPLTNGSGASALPAC